jgi:parallel beta-helix repeat protein
MLEKAGRLRRIASSLMVALLFSSLFAFALIIRPVKAGLGTIYIRADGSIDPPTAQFSTVDNITYSFTGNIINDSIVIERDNIVVDGAGYTIQGPGYLIGLDLSGRNNVTIRNMKIERFFYSVSLGSNCTVSNNTISQSDSGVYLSGSSGNTVSGNNITANYDDGVWLVSNSNYNTVSGNYISNNYDGVLLSFYSGCNTVSGNNITANRESGIWSESSSSSTVSGNNITANHHFGTYFGPSSNNTLSGNVFVDDGLLVGDSYGNAVADNSVNGKPLVYLEGVSDKVVEDAGQVILINCNRIRVEDLNLSHASVGVELYNTNSTTVSGNNITGNSEVGIALYSTYGSTLSNNNAIGNGDGIQLANSSNNTIYHNNFINNTREVVLFSSANTWDDSYPSGGNYWSDYRADDRLSGPFQNETGSDGIGDTAYTIDGINIDHYPLMASFAMSSFVVSLAGSTEPINVEVISNSTVRNVQIDETARTLSFNVSGETGTSGFSRIIVPNIIVEGLWNGNYTLLLNGEPWPFTSSSDTQDTYIYINYTHPEHQIIIVPEFPSNLLIEVFMMSTILYVMISKRRKNRADYTWVCLTSPRYKA